MDSYVAQARAICDAGQQKVYDEITTVLHGVVYPNTFPSDPFVRFYQYTHGIGLDVIAQLHGLAVPAGDEARRDGDLAVMGSAVGFTAAAARAAAGNDEAPYGRLVSRSPQRTAETAPAVGVLVPLAWSRRGEMMTPPRRPAW